MNTLAQQARIAADWIEKMSQEKICIRTEFPDYCVVNTNGVKPTPKEFADSLRFMATQTEHPAFIQVYRAVNGWQTALYVWTEDPDEPGCYEPFNTGMGPYGHKLYGYNTACLEATQWAKDENVVCQPFPTFSPLGKGEPSNILEAMQQISQPAEPH